MELLKLGGKGGGGGLAGNGELGREGKVGMERGTERGLRRGILQIKEKSEAVNVYTYTM